MKDDIFLDADTMERIWKEYKEKVDMYLLGFFSNNCIQKEEVGEIKVMVSEYLPRDFIMVSPEIFNLIKESFPEKERHGDGIKEILSLGAFKKLIDNSTNIQSY